MPELPSTCASPGDSWKRHFSEGSELARCTRMKMQQRIGDILRYRYRLLPRVVVDSTSLEVLKARLDGAWSNLG
ncbi:hypothetical protein BTVI_25179 [Pitangus sulphuratus]|nr:hypothetical protein BTVI_25179 [Pitangus sulphuratus]